MFKKLGAAAAAISLACAGSANAAVTMEPWHSKDRDRGGILFYCATCEQGEPVTFTTFTIPDIKFLFVDWHTAGLAIDALTIENAKPFTNVRLWANDWNSLVGQTDANGAFTFTGSSFNNDFGRYFRLTVGLEKFDVTSFAGHGYALATVLPEPSTWAMMIGGFGLAGSALRRRRLQAA